MPAACLLHKSKLQAFKDWLDLNGHEHRPTTADWQVLQVRPKNDTRWHAVYERAVSPEHYSVPQPLTRLVRAYIRHARTHGRIQPDTKN